MKISIPATLLYVLLLYLMSLARSAVGGFFSYLYFAVLLLPIAALVHVLLTMIFLRYVQDFSSYHSVRGDTVDYRLKLSNELPLFSANIHITFKHINPNMQQLMESRIITLKPGQKLEWPYHIACPYIGVYTIGLDKLYVTDVFSWIQLPLSVFFYTMYVYPRRLNPSDFTLKSLSPVYHTGSRSGSINDYSYFTRLEEYRQGDDLRLLAWKRFSADGIALMRRYNQVSSPAVSVYLDTRVPQTTTHEEASFKPAQQLESQDFSIELMISIAEYCLQNSIPVTLRAQGLKPISLRIEDDVQELINSCLDIEFSTGTDIFTMFRQDNIQQHTGSIILITPYLSAELSTLIARQSDNGGYIEAIINETSATASQKEKHRKQLANLGSAADHIRFADSSLIQDRRIVWG